MKHLLLAGLVLAATPFYGKAQNFNGSISYKMDVKNLPPGVSQEMIDQQVPSKMNLYVKGDKTATTINAGPFQRIITNAGLDTSYMIMDNAKRVFTMTSKDAESMTKDAKITKPVIKKTKTTATIAGYPCTMYEVSTEANGQKMTQNVWATESIKTPKSKVKGQSMLSSDVPGTMMKMTMKQMGMDMTIEATEISTAAPADSLFALPKGYLHKPFSQQNIMDAAMGK